MRNRWLLGAVLVAACGGEASEECGGVGTICRWAGTGDKAFTGDTQQRLTTALYWPVDLSFAPDGRAYVLDWQNHRVRRIGGDGMIQTVMGNDLVGDGPVDLSDLMAPGSPGREVELNHPTDVDFLPDGSVVVAAWHNHKVRRLDPATGMVTVTCGRGPGGTGDGGPAAMALLNQPKSLAVDAAGTIYVTDSRNQKIRRIGLDGIITTVAGSGMVGFAGDGGTPLMASFWMQKVDENPEPGGSIALDASGRIFLADTFNNRVRMIDLAAGTVTTVAGNGVRGFAGDGGPAIAASLDQPRDVEMGPDGRLYVADTDNDRVRVVDLTTGLIATVAGGAPPGGKVGNGGLATHALLQRPFGIAFDARGDLFIADTFSNTIRKVVMK